MGSREGFISSTNPKITAEKLGEYLAKSKDFHKEFPPVWIVCKSFAVKDTIFNVYNWFGEFVKTVSLHKGQELLCIGYESFTDVLQYFPRHIRKNLVLIDSSEFGNIDYPSVLRDEPVEVDGKSYFAELN